MAQGIKLDGVSFSVDLVRSFATEKECVDYFVTPKHAHHWPGLTKKELTVKYKLLYKLCKEDKNENSSMD
jgi:hypothetical protein